MQETIGQFNMSDDEKIIRDDVSVSLNDRINYDSHDYKVNSLRTETVQDTTVIKIIQLVEASSTTRW